MDVDFSHCYYHEIDELGPGYHTCGECGHLYQTAEELVEAYWDEAPAGFRRGPVEVEEITFCPYCIHDF